MKIDIQRFTLVLLICLLSILFTISFINHSSEREKTALTILQNIKTKLSETNYVLSKNITSPDMTVTFRPLLERIVANGHYIKAILIHDEQSILITTDPYKKEIFTRERLAIGDEKATDTLSLKDGIEETIKYYRGNKVSSLKLLFIFDKYEIKHYLYSDSIDKLTMFLIVPFIAIMLVWLIVRMMIVKPLEKLRQFAYYQDNIPKVFTIRELEVIRYSMVETFDRLEDEKKELYNMARTDSLSGLANRNSLMEYLNRLIAASKRESKEFAMLFLDLDHFKSVNDSLGHNVGDELLQNVSNIIDDILRSNDFVARVGGDEFIIIIQDYNSLRELSHIIERIQSILSKKWVIQANPVEISSSIGIAFYPKDGEDTVTLMKNSDIAMYEAKKNGRSGYSFFTDELNSRVQDTISLEKDMKEALKNNEYELYYQPKVDIVSGRIVGAEALIRWLSPTKGMIPPNNFIPLAEENGFIVDLGKWVYETAICQQKSFQEIGIDMKISINFSPKQFISENFFEKLTSFITQNQVSPSNIDIEITENMFIDNNGTNIDILNMLSDFGLSISLDDFGTGYSSLSYLKDFPINNLKIDKSFIDSYMQEKGNIFIETIVNMGKTLNMEVIAEGVESQDQLEYLKAIGCDQYQGYYFSKPLNVKDFESLVNIQI